MDSPNGSLNKLWRCNAFQRTPDDLRASDSGKFIRSCFPFEIEGRHVSRAVIKIFEHPLYSALKILFESSVYIFQSNLHEAGVICMEVLEGTKARGYSLNYDGSVSQTTGLDPSCREFQTTIL